MGSEMCIRDRDVALSRDPTTASAASSGPRVALPNEGRNLRSRSGRGVMMRRRRGRSHLGRGRGRLMRGAPAGIGAPLPAAEGCRRGEPGTAYRPVAFVHVNKAGGTAMRAILFKHAAHQMLERVVPAGGAYLRALHPPARWFHASASLQRKAVGQQQWNESYTLSLIHI